MSSISKGAGNHAAQNTVTGTISNGVTWYEDIVLTDENGDQLTDVADHTWQFQFRTEENNDSADLTLSTTAGTLSVAEDGGVTTLTIDVPQASIDSMEGDYFADLVSKDPGDSRLTHRAHGLVTFRESPVAF